MAGGVSRDEFAAAATRHSTVRRLLGLRDDYENTGGTRATEGHVARSYLDEQFLKLDVDGSGEISLAEFVDMVRGQMAAIVPVRRLAHLAVAPRVHRTFAAVLFLTRFAYAAADTYGYGTGGPKPRTGRAYRHIGVDGAGKTARQSHADNETEL